MNKVTSYTAEQTATIVEAFKAGTPIEVIATTVGKSARSVIAKLSREGVYTKANKTTTTATKVTKADLVAKIAIKFNVTTESLANLVKVDKATLEIIAA
jgi:hypothetical protein